MKSKPLPDYQKKQQVLYINATPEETLISYGDGYLAEGRIPDAVEFYTRAKYIPGLNRLKAIAVESGDAMVFQQVLKALNETVTDNDWKNLGEAALSGGKYVFAMYAFEKGGHADLIEQVKQAMHNHDQQVRT